MAVVCADTSSDELYEKLFHYQLKSFMFVHHLQDFSENILKFFSENVCFKFCKVPLTARTANPFARTLLKIIVE